MRSVIVGPVLAVMLAGGSVAAGPRGSEELSSTVRSGSTDPGGAVSGSTNSASASSGVPVSGSANASSAGAGRYAPPLPGRLVILRHFEPPPTPYSAGHRGVDLGARRSAAVLAARAGVVAFAGPVAGRGVVVIDHPDGIRTEYEPVAVSVSAGQQVASGQPIGRLRGRHGEWPPDTCLHWGARRGDTYIDPLLLLRPLGPVRLLPWPR